MLPAGWSVFDYCGVTIGRTIKGDLTPLQVCEECRDTYKVYIRWDNKDKNCLIYSQNMGSPVGSFASKELNLKEINYKGKSQNFATRLYAYGKDGLSFADINNNKPYVDNNTYSSRVICAYWQDERYTDKASLLAAATENLAKLAVPERSYDCAIVDLKATNPELYNNLDFSLFTVATLIDDVKETATNYQVVERHVWPYHPDLNDVIFNSAPVKIQNSVIQIEDEITNPQSTFQQILNARIEMVTDWLTNSNSHVYIVEDNNGGISEFLFVNGDQPIETATQVMRLNASGLGFSKNGVNGPFTNAFVFDSTLGGHLVADFITAGHMVADRIQGGTLESIDSTTIGGVSYKNFSLNMTTGLIQAVKLAIQTSTFTLDTNGKLKSRGPNTSPVPYVEIDQGVITCGEESNVRGKIKITDDEILATRRDNSHLFRLYGYNFMSQWTLSGVDNGNEIKMDLEARADNGRCGITGNQGLFVSGGTGNLSLDAGGDIWVDTDGRILVFHDNTSTYAQTGTFKDGDGNIITVNKGFIIGGLT